MVEAAPSAPSWFTPGCQGVRSTTIKKPSPLVPTRRRRRDDRAAPHRSNRRKPAAQDGRRLRRYATDGWSKGSSPGFNGSASTICRSPSRRRFCTSAAVASTTCRDRCRTPTLRSCGSKPLQSGGVASESNSTDGKLAPQASESDLSRRWNYTRDAARRCQLDHRSSAVRVRDRHRKTD